MYKGSCLCGAVEYEISGELGSVMHCHCSRCRKTSGADYESVATVPAKIFRFLKGERELRDYFNAAGEHRIFCGKCGAPIIGISDNAPETVRVRISSLDILPKAKPSTHILIGSTAEGDAQRLAQGK